MSEPMNASVEYVDAETGVVQHVDRFYDPLDENSWLARELKARGKWKGPDLAYGCGRPLRR